MGNTFSWYDTEDQIHSFKLKITLLYNTSLTILNQHIDVIIYIASIMIYLSVHTFGTVADSSSRLRLGWRQHHIKGILPKGPYLPCVSMAGRALLAGYPQYMIILHGCHFADDIFRFILWMKIVAFTFKFQLTLFLRVQLTISEHWLR